MKHFTHFKSSILRGLLSLFFLTAMVSSAWGQTINAYLNETQKTTYSVTADNKTEGSVNEVLSYSAPDATYSSPQWRLAAGKSVTFTVANGYKIDKIVVNVASTTNSGDVWTASAGSPSLSGTTLTVSDINSATTTLTTGEKKGYMKTINVYYKLVPSLSTPSNLSSSSITVSGAVLSWSEVANASSYKVKIGTTEYDASTNSYSAKGLTAGTQYSWSVKAIGDGINYSSSDYAKSANFTTEAASPAVTHIVTWSVNGQTTTEEIAEGSAITFNAPTSGIPDGKVFMGWYGSTYSNATTAPEYVKSATMGTEDVTYYAVFATKSGSGEITWNKVTDASTLNAGDEVTFVSSEAVDYNNNSSTKQNGLVAISQLNSNGNNWIAVGVSEDNNILTSTTGVFSFTLHATNNQDFPWAFQFIEDGTTKYIYAANQATGNSAKNLLKVTTDLVDGASFSIAINDGVATITANGGAERNVIKATGNFQKSQQNGKWSTPLFNCYASSNNSTLPSIYKKNGGVTYSEYTTSPANTLTLAAVSGDEYYATFSNAKAVEFTDAVVYTVELNESSLSFNEVESKQVPANTGVLVKSATTTAAYHFIESASALEGNNLLKPASEEMTGSYKFYRLAYDNYEAKEGLGFYWGAAEGGTFTCKAGGAYLAVPTSAGASEIRGFSFEDLKNGNETAIPEIDPTGEVPLIIYTMTGIRIPKVVEDGLYIVNGKTKWMIAE